MLERDIRSSLDLVVQGDEDGAYSVVELDLAGGYFVGRSSTRLVVLGPADSKPLSTYKLDRVLLCPSLRCTVTTRGARLERAFSVFELDATDPSFATVFADVAALFVRLSKSTAGPSAASSVMRIIVDMFRPTAVSNDTLGLFGELCVIAASDDAEAMVGSWHPNPTEKFDFAVQGRRLEVKTTVNAQRIHHFNLDQLTPSMGIEVLVASVQTARTDTGTSIADLVALLEPRLATSPHLQLKLHELVISTLGSTWLGPNTARYDLDQALESIRFVLGRDVPRVHEVDAGVLSIDLRVSLDDVPPTVERLLKA